MSCRQRILVTVGSGLLPARIKSRGGGRRLELNLAIGWSQTHPSDPPHSNSLSLSSPFVLPTRYPVWQSSAGLLLLHHFLILSFDTSRSLVHPLSFLEGLTVNAVGSPARRRASTYVLGL